MPSTRFAPASPWPPSPPPLTPAVPRCYPRQGRGNARAAIRGKGEARQGLLSAAPALNEGYKQLRPFITYPPPSPYLSIRGTCVASIGWVVEERAGTAGGGRPESRDELHDEASPVAAPPRQRVAKKSLYSPLQCSASEFRTQPRPEQLCLGIQTEPEPLSASYHPQVRPSRSGTETAAPQCTRPASASRLALPG